MPAKKLFVFNGIFNIKMSTHVTYVREHVANEAQPVGSLK